MNTDATKKNIFIAATPEVIDRILGGLDGHYNVTIAMSLSAIDWTALADMDLLMCNLHFDDGNMFELLQRVKTNPATRDIPFLCINSTSALSPALLHSVDSASSTKGAAAFADVHAWRSADGDERAYGRLRDLIDSLIKKQ